MWQCERAVSLSRLVGWPGRSSLQPVVPIVRPAMQVRDRKHQNVAIVHGIDQPVWKPTEPAAADAFTPRMPRLRKALDSVRGSQHLNQS